MEKEMITLSFEFFSPTNFEFRLAYEHGSCASLIYILSSTVALVFVFICFVLAFCLVCYNNGFNNGLQCKGDEQTSIHIDSTDKIIPKENSQLSSAKYRRNIRKSVSKEFDPVRIVHKVIVGEVQGHPSTCVTNPVPAESCPIQSRINADIRNIGRRGQRNHNRFQTRAEDFVKCCGTKNCVTTDADSPVISISSDKKDVCEGLRRLRKVAPCSDAKFSLPSSAESLDNFESIHKTEVRGGYKRQRQPNRFNTLAAALVSCTAAKVCLPSNADSPTSFVSRHKMDVHEGCKRQTYPMRFRTRAADLFPCVDAKLVLPSHADSPGRTISRDKTDVRGEKLQEDEELETASDDTENECSEEDIETDSDCINDPYRDYDIFFLETSKSLDLETDAITTSDKTSEKDDTKDYGLNSDMEPGKCVHDRVRLPRSQHNMQKKRKRKMTHLSSAKMSGETIIKGCANVMIGDNNTLISREDCKCGMKLDELQQTLDGLSARIIENSMKFDSLMQKLNGLSAMVVEFSRKPNCIQSVYAERGIFAVPCNCVQNIASAASEFRNCYACCLNKTSAEGLYAIRSKYDTVEMQTDVMNPHKDPCSSNVQSEQCDHISGTETDTEILI